MAEPAQARTPSGRAPRTRDPKKAGSRLLVGSVAILAITAGLTWRFLPRLIEVQLRRRLLELAAHEGIELRVGGVLFEWRGRVTLLDLEARRRYGRDEGEILVVSAHRIVTRFVPGLPPRIATVSTESLRVGVPARRVELDLLDAEWQIVDLAGSRVAMRARVGTRDAGLLRVSKDGDTLQGTFTDLDLSRLLRIGIGGRRPLRPGEWTGNVRVARRVAENGGETFAVDVLLHIEDLRLGLTQHPDSDEPDNPTHGAETLGEPISFDLAAELFADPPSGLFEVACWDVRAEGFESSGRAIATAGEGDAWADIELVRTHLDLARVLRASGLPLAARGLALPPELGAADLELRVTGQLSQPEGIQVRHRLAFDPPQAAVLPFRAFAGPFVHEIPLADGTVARIVLERGSPDYVSLEEVPPLFVRAVTIAEDAGFFGHPGIDLAEIPVAFATNLGRGVRARGASTISQQLARNLFLSRERTYGRKLKEVALTLLLEAALPKERILEIYLNVIEWGPGIHGLRSASRHYFSKEPSALSPREMAFLVSLIPGPVKYQRSFASGTVSPGFNLLVVRVLAKLRSVEALSEEDYQRALSETLVFRERAPS